TCATDAGQALHCWSVGVDTVDAPGIIKDGTQWQQFSVGLAHACAITTGGELYCWGRNHSGQLGNDMVDEADSPVLVEHDRSWRQVSASYRFTCAIDVDDGLYCWGDNTFGQLGNGKTEGR